MDPKGHEEIQQVSGNITGLPVDTFTPKATTISAGGDNVIHTPAGGQRIRLYYVSYSADGANTADVVVFSRFGAGGAMYKVSLKPGSIYARNVGAGRRFVQGAPDEVLNVNLSTGGQGVHVSVEVDEI